MQYPMDRVGSCNFLFVAEEKQLRHRVSFNTTEPKRSSWLDGKRIARLYNVAWAFISYIHLKENWSERRQDDY